MAVTLTQDQINQLLAGSRSKGAGDQTLADFLASGEAGIEVPLDSGAFAGKTAVQAATGLNAAKKRVDKDGNFVHANARQVQVIKRKIGEDEHVFLIDKSKVSTDGASAEETPAEA